MNKVFTIVVGGNIDTDLKEFFDNSNKVFKQPRNVLYLKTMKQLKSIMTKKGFIILTFKPKKGLKKSE